MRCNRKKDHESEVSQYDFRDGSFPEQSRQHLPSTVGKSK